MNHRYRIIVKSQLGPKSGSLKLRTTKGKSVFGIFELLGHKTLLRGTRLAEGNRLELKGQIHSPLGYTECLLCAAANEDGLIGELKVGHMYYEISGKRS